MKTWKRQGALWVPDPVPTTGLRVKATLHDEHGREVGHATHNTITAYGLSAALARVFGVGAALNSNFIMARAGGSDLAGMATGYPQNATNGVTYQTEVFTQSGTYALGSINMTDGTSDVFTTSGWVVSTTGNQAVELNDGGRYFLSWNLVASVVIQIPDDLPDEDDFDDPDVARQMFLTAQSVGSAENFVVRRWAGLTGTSLASFTVELWGPDDRSVDDGGSGLPPFEALQAGNTILQETVSATGAVSASSVNVEFTLPAYTDGSAFSYRYAV